ncbi:MAG: hypothetical protein QME61_00260, partial [Patescibacteria group bacterium]|nr:hypothetical protein [Patescibacteria group bacterium]
FKIQNSKITYQELLKELANLGAKLLIETIPKWIGGEIKPQPRDESRATYTKILKKRMEKLIGKKRPKKLKDKLGPMKFGQEALPLGNL